MTPKLLFLGLLLAVMFAAACAPSPQYSEGNSRFSGTEDGGIDFDNKRPLFVIDHGDFHGITEIFRGNDTLFYAIDRGSKRTANTTSAVEVKAVLLKLISEGYVVEKIEINSDMLFIYLAGYNDVTSARQGKDGIFILPEDILGD